jgi:hypothetical protein
MVKCPNHQSSMANNENMASYCLYDVMMDKLSGLSGWKDGIFKEYLEKSLEWTALKNN